MSTNDPHPPIEIDGRFMQGAGVLQGGVCTGLLGDAMAGRVQATLMAEGSPLRFALESLDIAFLRPGVVGSFTTKVGLTRRTRSTMHAEGEVRDASDRVVVTGRATFVLCRDTGP